MRDIIPQKSPELRKKEGKMNANEEVIAALCSRLCVTPETPPLTAGEWNKLACILHAAGSAPQDLAALSREELQGLLLGAVDAERILRLLDRTQALCAELGRWASRGVCVLTPASEHYPARLGHKLGAACPPVFYCAGDPALLACRAAGFAGTRSAVGDDLAFAERMAARAVAAGFAVVTGGARGVDAAASEEAQRGGGHAIEFLAAPMERKLVRPAVQRNLREGRLLLLSAASPNAEFRAGFALQRNKFIYAHAEGTIVVSAELGRGGTWTGATEALKAGWNPVYCRRQEASPGNMALIQKGAVPIGEAFDFRKLGERGGAPHARQISLYD